jgi:hypothetical protein
MGGYRVEIWSIRKGDVLVLRLREKFSEIFPNILRKPKNKQNKWAVIIDKLL